LAYVILKTHPSNESGRGRNVLQRSTVKGLLLNDYKALKFDSLNDKRGGGSPRVRIGTASLTQDKRKKEGENELPEGLF